MSLVGKPAPAANLWGTDRKPFPLESLRGGRAVLAFFPGVFTGVCTKEMCTLQDSLSAFQGWNTKVVGISVDAPSALTGFAEKTGATFPLVSDYTRETARAFGVTWKDFGGLPGYEVANRAVFVLDEAGKVIYEWIAPNPGVEPDYAAIKAAVS